LILEIATWRRKLNLVVDPQILQRTKEGVAVSGETDIASLARQRRPAYVSDSAPQSGSADSLHYNRGKPEAGNFNTADQTLCKYGKPLLWGAIARHARIAQLAVKLPALAPLESPGIREHKSAVAQKQDGTDKQHAMGPIQRPPECLLTYQ
jgi:hypothetical protein